MKRLIYLFIFLFPIFAYCQTDLFDTDYIKENLNVLIRNTQDFKAQLKNGRWVKLDNVTVKEIFNVDVEMAFGFESGLAPVRSGGKWGFIDMKSNVKIDFIYDAAGGFSEGMSSVYINGKYGFIDTLGKLVIEHQFDYAKEFIQGVCITMNDQKFGIIDYRGRKILKHKYDFIQRDKNTGLFFVKKGNLFSLANKKGKFLTDFIFDKLGASTEGFIPASRNGQYGFIDMNGLFIIAPMYEDIMPFFKGYAPVGKNGQWFFINESGHEVDTNVYDLIRRLNTEIILVKKGEKFGIVDFSGKTIIPVKHQYVHLIKNSDLIEVDSFGFGIIHDYRGNRFSQHTTDFEFIPQSFENNLLRVVKKSSDSEKLNVFGYINRLGDLVIDYQYDLAYPFYKGAAVVKKGKFYGMIDTSGQTILPFDYVSIDPFENDQSIVKLKDSGKEGLVGINAEYLVPPIYSSVRRFEKGFSIVCVDGYIKCGVINKVNDIVIDTIYRVIEILNNGFKIELNNKWGFFDFKGNTVLPFEYERSMSNYYGLISAKREGKACLYNKKGELIISCEYDKIILLANGDVKINKEGLWGVMDRKGNLLLPVKYNEIKNKGGVKLKYQVRLGAKWSEIELKE